MRALLVSAVAGLALVAGCSGSVSVGSKTLDKADVEKEVSTQLEATVGQAPDDVKCPDDLEAKVDQSMTCTLTADGTEYDVTVTVTSVSDDGNAKLDIQVADQPNE